MAILVATHCICYPWLGKCWFRLLRQPDDFYSNKESLPNACRRKEKVTWASRIEWHLCKAGFTHLVNWLYGCHTCGNGHVLLKMLTRERSLWDWFWQNWLSHYWFCQNWLSHLENGDRRFALNCAVVIKVVWNGENTSSQVKDEINVPIALSAFRDKLLRVNFYRCLYVYIMCSSWITNGRVFLP